MKGIGIDALAQNVIPSDNLLVDEVLAILIMRCGPKPEAREHEVADESVKEVDDRPDLNIQRMNL